MKKVFFIIIIGTILVGCSNNPYYEPTVKPVFKVVTAQKPDEPVYYKKRLVYLPSTTPGRQAEMEEVPMILPVFDLSLEDVTLEDTAIALAATSRYGSYCASSIADRKFSIEALGTVDELAHIIAKKAEIKVIVDHVNKQVRFFAGSQLVEPRFSDGDRSLDEQH